MTTQKIEYLRRKVQTSEFVDVYGKVVNVTGLSIEAVTPASFVGELCAVQKYDGGNVFAEVVGFKEGKTLLMPIGDVQGVGPGSLIRAMQRPLWVRVGPSLIGRVIDAIGNPLDDKGPIRGEMRTVYQDPPHPLRRKHVNDALETRIKAIDGLLTVGKGQRLGIFAGSGVGKSTLLGMLARNSAADVNVVILVGERGREVRKFIEEDLTEEGARKSVIVVATSDQPALLRVKAVLTGMTIAEYFRDEGMDVLVMMDSVTRFAMAQREIGLSVGEPPTTRGYTPSVFALLPKVLERAGTSDRGSITAFITVLVEGDDMNEPVADAVRSILDGHIVLSRSLAHRAHYPAIDVLQSVSRVMSDVVSEKHLNLAYKMREILAVYRDAEDLVNIGAYQRGNNPRIDLALDLIEPINRFLKQQVRESVPMDQTVYMMEEIVGHLS
ncbi:flagellar protein export ATPase FliI [Coprothermobacteraceae bacterium]|nr:flagellar protein export ATPase FliI [Coprothermobacteraceae bacterium]